MFREYEIEFEITKEYKRIISIIEEHDCHDTKLEFVRSLINDDMLSSYAHYGLYTFEDEQYDVYQLTFNDCEECDPVFIGLKELKGEEND